MKKDTKVIIMKAKTPNGNDHTYRTLAPLDFTVADACNMRKISLLTIRSASVTAPMTETDAVAYLMNDVYKQMLDPNVMIFSTTYGKMAA